MQQIQYLNVTVPFLLPCSEVANAVCVILLVVVLVVVAVVVLVVVVVVIVLVVTVVLVVVVLVVVVVVVLVVTVVLVVVVLVVVVVVVALVVTVVLVDTVVLVGIAVVVTVVVCVCVLCAFVRANVLCVVAWRLKKQHILATYTFYSRIHTYVQMKNTVSRTNRQHCNALTAHRQTGQLTPSPKHRTTAGRTGSADKFGQRSLIHCNSVVPEAKQAVAVGVCNTKVSAVDEQMSTP